MGYALVNFTQWWNSVCTAIETNVNTLASQQTQIDNVLGIATDAASSAASAGSAAAYALESGNAITPLTPIASNDVVANLTAGSAIPIGNTLTATIDANFGTTQGAILYRNASAWVILAPGTAAQTLHTGGAGANPYWA